MSETMCFSYLWLKLTCSCTVCSLKLGTIHPELSYMVAPRLMFFSFSFFFFEKLNFFCGKYVCNTPFNWIKIINYYI